MQSFSDRLKKAINEGENQAVSFLSLNAHHALVDEPDEMGITPLHLAAQLGYRQLAVELVKRGAKVDAQDQFQTTPLHFAVAKSDLDTVRALLENGANPNLTTSTGQTALMKAVYVTASPYALPIVTLLLQHNAKPSQRSKDGKTALHIAVSYRNAAAIQLLLDHNVDMNCVDSAGNTPVILAAQIGSPALICSFLLVSILSLIYFLFQGLFGEKGADPSIRNAEGKIAADYFDGFTATFQKGITQRLEKQEHRARREEERKRAQELAIIEQVKLERKRMAELEEKSISENPIEVSVVETAEPLEPLVIPSDDSPSSSSSWSSSSPPSSSSSLEPASDPI